MKLDHFALRHVALCACLLLVPSGVASAADYYVSNSGTDGRSCAQARSIGTPKQSIISGINCLSAGDTLMVRGGTYPEAIVGMPSGTSWGNVVRVQAYNGETVWMNPSGSEYVVYFAQREQYIEFDGINMDSSRTRDGNVTIQAWAGGNPHHIRFKNAEMIGQTNGITEWLSGPTQISMYASVPGAIGGNEFINLRVHGGGDPGDFAYGFYLQSSDNLVDSCNIYDVSGAAIQIYNAFGQSANNNTIRNNILHDITRSGDTRVWGIVVGSGSDNSVYNNVIYNVGIAGYGNAGINVFSGSRARIYNNTIYGSRAAGIYAFSGSQTQIVNNIIYGNAGGNLLNYNSDTYIANNLTSDPGFVNAGGADFRLRADSPAIDRGAYLSMVQFDQIGMPRPQGGAYDIGAYEFGSGGGGSPAPPPAPSRTGTGP